ncbi:MAG: MMPL family transporter [Nibricoccus sp.]
MSFASLTNALEAFVFRRRLVLVLGFAALTALMAFYCTRIRVDASFNKQLPLQHPYIQTFTKHQEQFGSANRVIIALMAKGAPASSTSSPAAPTIFTPAFFKTLKAATDEVFFMPGVERSQVQSLFTPNTRYVEVVEDGFAGGTVIPAGFQNTPGELAVVRENVIKSGKVGQLVANDFSGAIISAQLIETDPVTGKKLDYIAVAHDLETRIRQKFQSDEVSVHIIGFAKVIGDVSEGARGVVVFFFVSFFVTGLLVYLYSHSLRMTIPPLICSFVAVVWQLGLLSALGYGIDPLSILVPFLVFAIGVSHAVQMVRAFRAEMFAGQDNVSAARGAFRQLLIPGGAALLADTFGFLTMLVIKIQTIQELAITASLGVAVVIVSNLFLLPILLSYQKIPARYQTRVAARKVHTDALWRKVSRIMEPKPSIAILIVSAILGVFAWYKSQEVRIGDLHAGVPELRQNSRYNRDSRLITEKFSIGVDILSVMVETEPNGCVNYDVLSLMDDLEGRLRALPGVKSVISVPTVAKMVNAGWNEGSLKWRILPRHPNALAQAVSPIETATGLLNADGSVMPMMIFLTDHKAETLRSVTDTVKAFQAEHSAPTVGAALRRDSDSAEALRRDSSSAASRPDPADPSRDKPAPTPNPAGTTFRLASGNAGVMAATNEVVHDAQFPILLWVFGAVIGLCLLTFRSWKATLCIVIPLALVSWLAYVVMVYLQIGLKTSTLPVVALGVGIGVDYGIYLYAKLRAALESGEYFEDAMYLAFTQTGSAVVFTGLTLAIGVSMWLFSDLKFQADMGVLLTFMFLVNMLGAIILMPALARWLFRHHTRKNGTSAPFSRP